MGIRQYLVFGVFFISSTIASANLVCTNIFTLDAAPSAPATETQPDTSQTPQFSSVNDVNYSEHLLKKANSKEQTNEALLMLVESTNRVIDDIVEVLVSARKESQTDKQMLETAEVVHTLMERITNAFEVDSSRLEEAIILRVTKVELEDSAMAGAQQQREPIGFTRPKKQDSVNEVELQLQILTRLQKFLDDFTAETVERGPMGFTGKKRESADEIVEKGPMGFRSKKETEPEGSVENMPIGFAPPKKGSEDSLEPTITIFLNAETGFFEFVKSFE